MPKRSHRRVPKARNPKISIAGQKARKLSWVAHHEAAHAVARLRLRPYAGYGVTIVPSGSTLGVAPGQDPFSSGRLDERTGELVPDVQAVEAAIVELLAGYVGSVRAGCPAAQAKRLDCSDEEKVTDLLRYTSRARTALRRETTQLVQREWNAIAAVAQELLARLTLDIDEIEIVADPTLSEGARAQRLEAHRVGVRPPREDR